MKRPILEVDTDAPISQRFAIVAVDGSEPGRGPQGEPLQPILEAEARKREIFLAGVAQRERYQRALDEINQSIERHKQRASEIRNRSQGSKETRKRPVRETRRVVLGPQGEPVEVIG